MSVRSLGLACAIAVLSACTDDTEPLDDPLGRDASPADRGGPDAGPTCATYVDCVAANPGLPGCPNRTSCSCGSYVTCENARCIAFSNEFCPDAGTPSPECTAESDCADAPSVPICDQVGYPQGTSCVDHRCVAECGSVDRTCTVRSGACLSCELDREACVNECASAGIMRRFHIEESTCRIPMDTVIEVADDPGTSCSYVASDQAGNELGRYHLLDDFTYLADFPQFGGHCTGFALPTNAERIVFNCPLCQMVFGP